MHYYNEFDPFAAQWLENLIKGGLIPLGHVDRRSITEVNPDELQQYAQCHFFAGIAGWAEALRLAGIPPEVPLWTGSCPCQPFSAAGKRKADEDERHLWPVWFDLIRVCRPPVIFGEQVEAAIGIGWLDRVFDDLEAEGYACGAAVLPACSVGAPHIRARLYWVAYADGWNCKDKRMQRGWEYRQQPKDGCAGSWMAYAQHAERRPISADRHNGDGEEAGRDEGSSLSGECCEVGWLANSKMPLRRRPGEPGDSGRGVGGSGCGAGGLGDSNNKGPQGRSGNELPECTRERSIGSPGTSNFWSNSQYIYCRDGKYRRIPVEPALFPLASRIPGRVGQLRAAGNAIVSQVAAEFIKATGVIS